MRTSWALLIVLCGCASPEDDWSLPVRAEIVASEDGVYALREVEFETLLDLPRMQGSIGSITGGASLNIDADINEIIRSDAPEDIYRKRGRNVDLDFLVRNEVVIPKNFQTMEILGLYYAYERTLLYWRDVVGVSFDDNYPSVFYNPSFSTSRNGQRTEVVFALNAAYLSGAQHLWFFKTSRREQLPVKMNFGVVAHEFGHYIFDRYFARFDPSFYESPYTLVSEQLSGMNEGLADFFSYMVTGSVEEYGASLSELGQDRRMPIPWRMSNLDESGCEGGFYCKGSLLASALHEIVQSTSVDALELGEQILQALELFREDWLDHRNQLGFDYHFLINRILDEAPSAMRADYCQIFQAWFDTEFFAGRLACDI